MRSSIIAGCLALVIGSSSAFSTTLHVYPDGSGDYPTIQSALDAAAEGDTVEVACGTYHERGMELTSGVVVRSETGSAECVTVDCESLGRAFSGHDLGASTVLEGFSIERGHVEGGWPEGVGAALFLENSSLVVRSCAFVSNSATDAGAVIALGASSTTFESCRFVDNTAFYDGGGAYIHVGASAEFRQCVFEGNSVRGMGAGIRSHETGPIGIIDCVFSNNEAGPGGAAGAGGGAFLHDTPLTLSDSRFISNRADHGGALILNPSDDGTTINACEFTGNRANGSGGALLLSYAYSFVMDHCTFVDNSATDGSGGAISIFGGNEAPPAVPVIRHTVIARCTATESGGGVHCESTPQARLENCTIVKCSASEGGGIYSRFGVGGPMEMVSCIIAGSLDGGSYRCDPNVSATPELTCCDVFGNVGGDWADCIAGQEGVNGNLSADPMFCDGETDDFTLRGDSPCLPDNHPDGVDCGLIGALGLGCVACTTTAPTISVPWDYATITEALAVAVQGDVICVTDGDYPEATLQLKSGVHLVGVGASRVRILPAMLGQASMMAAVGLSDSTVISGFALDGSGTAIVGLHVDSSTSSLNVASSRISNLAVGVLVELGASGVVLGGDLAAANDIYGNSAFNVVCFGPDTVQATHNYWGTTAFGWVEDGLSGPVNYVPITDSTHTEILWPTVSAPLLAATPQSLVAVPNPFTARTTLSFSMGATSEVTVSIFDVAGRLAQRLCAGTLPIGTHRLEWNGRDREGSDMGPGVYFVRLETAGAVVTRKVVRLRK